ncbi:MAG: N4-gp56 family major capsid protein [Peptoclostridium sp.]|uniref:N4-gp56 family major capsid protein n=1 Tax=Peptoclostridium sp. TaxID=1904860 RepID=UPI00139C4AD3|nr:N4-gp56 family major capsid protein [Peptoclostridium sp.]MZQ75259.1 N4-gp56 family major capsid protein [Peptoclostridium sp.]
MSKLFNIKLQLFATGTTALTNMVNPQVMADMVSAELPSKLKFAPIASVDTTLQGQPGTTITIPAYNYVGEADDLTEGVAMGTVVLETTTKTATIKEAGKAVEITDKAVNSGYGDPLGEAKNQIVMSINDKIDSDCVTALAAATLTHDISAEVTNNFITYTAVVDAVDKFQEEDDEARILFIHPSQKTRLRKDENFIRASDLGDNVLLKGTIGELAGCQVVASNKVPYDDVTGKYTNLIVKPGALAIYLKAKANIEDDRDILKRTTVLAASEYYVAALANPSKVVKFICKN